MSCSTLESAAVELYFYDELGPPEREAFERHLRGCSACAAALDELRAIRSALGARPLVCAPPGERWDALMQRLDDAIRSEPRAARVLPLRRLPQRRYAGLLATAALLAVVVIGILLAARQRAPLPETVDAALPSAGAGDVSGTGTGLHSAGEKHFERSKLVVLGLAARPGEATPPGEWTYERELAGALLADTRLYRLAAEQSGLTALAGVMRDLEIVLLEASMAEETNPDALSHIQRLIQKRGLIEKMDAVASVGMTP